MSFADALPRCSVILTEAAVSERLRRRDDISLHPTLFNTPLIYDAYGRQCLTDIYSQYRQIAVEHGLPLLLCAPTWRLDRSRIAESDQKSSINRDAVAFMRQLQQEWQTEKSPVFVAGLVGPKNDCYQPTEAPSEREAEDHHRWQFDELASAGVDVVIAQTFPAVPEALGVIRASTEAKLPCIMSFVINRRAEVLDTTPLMEAITRIDNETGFAPLGYMVNCVYPAFLRAEDQPGSLFERLVGIQANASSLDHTDLDGSATLKQDDPERWADHMVRLNRRFGVKILGGCCGTDETYLQKMVEKLAAKVVR